MFLERRKQEAGCTRGEVARAPGMRPSPSLFAHSEDTTSHSCKRGRGVRPLKTPPTPLVHQVAKGQEGNFFPVPSLTSS